MLRVRWIGTGGPGTPYYGAFHFGGTTEGEALIAVSVVEDFWVELSAEINTALTITVQPEVDVVDPATGNVTGTFITPGGVVDCAGGGALPPSNQGLIRWRTGEFVAGREIRGKTFIPLVPQEYSNGGVPAVTYTTALQQAGNNLLSNGVGAGGLVVYSDTHNQAALVSAASPWNQFAVLRSRRD